MVSLIVIGCILLNFGGKIFAQHYQLPLWLDSFGTVLAAYFMGPVCGAIVGASLNITYGLLFSYTQIIYALINIAVGVIIGICAKKGYLEYMFGVLSVSFFVTLMCTVSGTILCYLFFDGSIGNIWGDGVCEFLELRGCNGLLSHVIAEFYMEFVDKVVMLVALFIFVRIYRSVRKKRGVIKTTRLSAILLSAVLLTGLLPVTVHADTYNSAQDTQTAVDYNGYIQTVYSGENGLPGGMANDIA